MTHSLSIRFLGGFQVCAEGQALGGFTSPRVQSLLAYLVLHQGASQPRKRLAALLWPDTSEEQARTNLRKTIYFLRQALPSPESFFEDKEANILWRTDAPCSVDVTAFESAVAVGAFEQAASLYSGDLLPDCYDDWVVEERERLTHRYQEALERLVQQKESARAYGEAINYAQRLLAADPLREEVHRHIMQLHALNNDRAAALHAYQNCYTILQRELNVEPSPATRRIYERLLNQPVREISPLAGSFSLIGRAGEWTVLLDAWNTAASGKPGLILVSGEAGIGKTRLTEELVAWVDHQSVSIASTGCYAAEGALAYAPVIPWLRERPIAHLNLVWRSEVSRLMPEAVSDHAATPGPLTEAWQRQRFHEALARAILGADLAASEPLLLVIEDLQWCDSDTLAWLSYLLRYSPRARLLVLATLRCETAPDNGCVTTLLDDLRRRRQLAEIELKPLDAANTACLGEQVMGSPLDEQTRARLYQETEGNPLFIVEYARAGIEVAPSSSNLPEKTILPRMVQAAISARFHQLSPPAYQVMETAAVIGREFSYNTLLLASAQAEDMLVLSLDELWQRRVIREKGKDAYDFSHDKMRQIAYGSLTSTRKRMLHRRVAETLVTLHQQRLDAISGEVARHYEQAGDFQNTVIWLRKAADASVRIGAYIEAIGYMKRTLALLPPDDSERPGLMLRIGIQSLVPYGSQDVTYIRQALELARSMGDQYTTVNALLGLCRSATNMSKFAEALQFVTEGISLAKELGDCLIQGRSMLQLGHLKYNTNETQEAIPALHESLALLQCVPETEAQEAAGLIRRAYNNLGLSYLRKNQFAAAKEYFQKAIDLCEQNIDLPIKASLLTNLGWTAYLEGAYDEVEPAQLEAIKLYREQSDHGGVAVASMNIGHAAIQLRQLNKAGALYMDALKAIQNTPAPSLFIEALIGIATVWAMSGKQLLQAAELLGVVENHPICNVEPDLANMARRVRETLEALLSPADLANATARGSTCDLDQVAAQTLAELEQETT